MSYSEAQEIIERGLTHLSANEFEEFRSKFGLAEAYLPIEAEERELEINRLVSRLSSLSRTLSDDNYTPTSNREFIDRFTQAADAVVECMDNEDEPLSDARARVDSVQDSVEFTGSAEPVPENSPWGNIVQSMLDDGASS